MIIYKTTNLVNQKYYIGKDQKNKPRYLGSGIALNRAIQKYGRENFKKEILEECSDPDTLAKRERFWIAKFNACKDPMSYNIHEGGRGGNTGAYHKVGRSGPANASYGRQKTVEQKAAHSYKMKEYHKTEPFDKKMVRIDRIRSSQLNKPKNPTSVAKMSATRKKQCSENVVTNAVYYLTSPAEVTFTFNGKKELTEWCVKTNNSLWVVERRLLADVQPKSGSLVGWTASVIKSYRIMPIGTDVFCM